MSQKTPVVIDTAPEQLRQFDNRMRILMNLPSDAWPEGERKEVNPHSWGLWVQGRREAADCIHPGAGQGSEGVVGRASPLRKD